MPDSGEEPAEATEKDQWTELDFRLVEIVNQEPVDPLPEVLEANPGAQKLEVDGKRGQVLSWIEEQGKYLVETFDGDQAPVPWDHLREYEPPDPEAGGFHVAMPRSDFRAEYFPMELAEALESKLYCVIQATSTPGARKSAARNLVEREEKWTRIMPDMEPAYMGQNPGGKKILWLSHSDEHDDDPSVEHGLAEADRVLTTLSGFLGPICPSLGFEAIHRTNAFVHARCSSRGEEEELLEAFWEPTYKITAEEMQAHLSFKYRRKLCMMYFVNGSGGTLTLHPSYKGWDDIKISCQENQIVVFRHDICDYTFWPEGKQFCVQAWILRAPQAGEVGISSADKTDRYNEAIDMIPDGPGYGTSPESVDCMSLACRYPGVVWAPEDYWNLLSVGCDGGLKIPNSRWDHDLYYDPNPETMTPGKAYAQHFGMLEIDALANFESTFFGIPEDEAECIDPPCRVMLEVGYDCLYRGGWTRKKLEGSTIGTCYGTAESEFAGMLMAGFWGAKKKARIGLMPAMTCSRLQYCFSIKGPTSTAETACSSALSATCVMHHWMRPQMPDQFQKRTMCAQVPYGLAGGLNAAFNANTMIGFCGAHMLSIQGRCFTFDQGGDGFLRAEGIGAMFYKTSHGEDHARLSMLVASQMNQDGRSASLTAPHGPSQQECIRYCLREGNILPFDVQVQELHGTGTALGDPIETGSLRATMMMLHGEVREQPLVKTSSKSNFGHTELNAGMCGIMKCALLGVFCAATANCHIRLLNPHIDINEYPVHFSTELIDQNKDTAYCGVSSFGWSGCNARGDMWSRCMGGPRNTDPGERRMDFTERRIFWYDSINRLSAPPEPASRAGPALDDLEAYTGEYGSGCPGFEENTFYVTGTFSGWTTMQEMEWLDDRGSYASAFTLGEAGVEQFRIVVNKSHRYAIFPAAKMADSSSLVLGPGTAPAGQSWAIDGRREGAPAGTVFFVFFTLDPESKMKRIWWEATTDERALKMAAGVSFRHSYSLVGTWTVWKPVKMGASNKEGERGVFEVEVKIGIERKEAFRILRDADSNQAIYPVRVKAEEGEQLQVKGPDHRHGDKKWEISGKMGDVVRLRFRAWEGNLSLSVISSKGVETWGSETGPAAVYYVTATWNKYGFSAMSPDPKKEGVYTLKHRLSAQRMEAFQIVIDQDYGQVIHPEIELADQLLSQAFGPDGKGEGLQWGLFGMTGVELKITLDLNQVDIDRRKVVTWSLDAPDVIPRREGLDPSADAPVFPTYDYEAT
uniref:Ketosynthase family 3 (KS3) domain-containing protein n=1 Tax=Alexandrium monilatum TaxID=311494 RepID=A0A7S4VDS0_9DINO